MKNQYSLNIAWLYPELMNTYGDRGNIICIIRRCEQRKIECAVNELNVGFKPTELEKSDFIFMGGAQDRQQQIVVKDLFEKSKVLKKTIDSGKPGLYICGAYQFLGKYYKEADGTVINGLGIIDLYTESPGFNIQRLIGNVAVKTSISEEILIGFENHGGRTYLGKDVMPLGKVIAGNGNNGMDKTEGAIHKNSYCSYLHGPILPKNPLFADFLVTLALEKKYSKKITLPTLDDILENQARKAIASKLNVKV